VACGEATESALGFVDLSESDARVLVEPFDCEDRPLTLTLDADGLGGSIGDWPNHSQLALYFNGELPVLSVAWPGFDGSVADDVLGTQWSRRDSSSGYIYPQTNTTTLAVVDGAADLSQVGDVADLEFAHDASPSRGPGEYVVLRHEPSDRYLAIWFTAVEAADPTDADRYYCTFASLRWRFARRGRSAFD